MRVDVDGASLRVERDGEGTPIMVPTGGGVEFYRRTLSPALRRRFHFHFVEMRGTGGSTGSVRGASFATLADDLEQVRRSLSLGPVLVLGHSNHGCIALEHGLRHPSGSAGVVSVAGVLDGRRAVQIGMERWKAEASPQQQRDLDARMAAFAASDTSAMSHDERTIRQYLSLAPLGWRDPDLASPSWGDQVVAGVGAYFDWMRKAVAAYDATGRVRRLSVPLLAVVGRHDYICPLQTWAGGIGASAVQIVVFDHSAHHPQVEQPDRFDRLVTSFVHAALSSLIEAPGGGVDPVVR
jgi:proline iminopeptidase